MKNKKLIIIFIILILGAVAVYFFVIKPSKNDDSGATNTTPPDDTVDTCFDIIDKNECNSAVDSESGNKRCEYNDNLEECLDITINPTCEDPANIISLFYRGNDEVKQYYNQWSSLSGEKFGDGKYTINEDKVKGTEPNPNVIITDFGQNPTEYCNFSDYDIDERKINTDASCSFKIEPQINTNNNLFPENNKLCQNNPETKDLFYVSDNAGNCSGIVNSRSVCTDFDSDRTCDDHSDFCTWDSIENKCKKKTSRQEFDYICGKKSTIMKNCYDKKSNSSCNAPCQWRASLKNRVGACVPEEYPLGNNLGGLYDITNYYTFNNINCSFDSNGETTCSTNN